MKLSELVAQYVSHKRALGMRFDSEAATLASFCRRVDGNIDVESVTVEQVHDFLTGKALFGRGVVGTFWMRYKQDFNEEVDRGGCRIKRD